MSESGEKRVPLLLWPFYAIWRLLTLILEVAGRMLAAMLGLVLMFAGVMVTMTLVMAPIGIPIAVFGVLLLTRALF